MNKRNIKHRNKHCFDLGGAAMVANSALGAFDKIANVTGLYNNLGYDQFEMPQINLGNINTPTSKTDLANQLRNGGHLFDAGGAASIIEGVGNIAATTVETAKTNAQLRNQDIANNNRANSLSLINSSINTNTDDGLLQASSNAQYGYGLGAQNFMRSKAQNIGTTALGSVKASAQGFSAGMKTGNPWVAAGGAIVGGVSGLLGGIFGARKNKRKARKEAAAQERLANYANANTDAMLANAQNRVALNREMQQMSHLQAEGGALDYDLLGMQNMVMQKNALNKQKITSLPNSFGQQFAFGGTLSTNGADWSNGLTFFDNGGTHEENPNDGIPQGMASDGLPNLVEEGEVKWDAENYIFSNRLKPQKGIRSKYKLKDNLTYSDAVKKLTKEAEERPNDPISKRGKDAVLQELANDQEELKAKKEEQRMRRMLNNMTPEEREAFLMQMAQQQQAEQQMMQQQQPSYTPEVQYAQGGHLFPKGGKPDISEQDILEQARAAKIQQDVDNYNQSVQNARQNYSNTVANYNSNILENLELEELMKRDVPITALDFASLTGAQSSYEDPLFSGTIQSNPKQRQLAVDIEQNEKYKKDTQMMLDALNGRTENMTPKEYERYIAMAMAIDNRAKQANIPGYKPLFNADGSINIANINASDGLVYRRNDQKNGPYHTMIGDDGKLIEIPGQPGISDPPGKHVPGTSEIENPPLEVMRKKSELGRLAPIAAAGANYLDMLSRDPHIAIPAGTKQVGPQTINDYLEYRPSDTRRQWNDQRQALQGISNDINNGNTASSNAMRIAAMNQMQNALGEIQANAEEANYNRRAQAVQQNAGVNQFNAQQVYNSDVYNAGAYDRRQDNLAKAQLLNNQYEDEIFNGKVAARNALANLIGKRANENRADNMAIGNLLAQGVPLQKQAGYFWGLNSYRDQANYVNEYNKNRACGGKINTKKYNKKRR